MVQYLEARYRFHKWRYEAGWKQKAILVVGVAALTGLSAQLRIPLPFTPVPITGQVFMVLLSAIILGRLGGVSQTVYVGLGAIGVPWFNGLTGGLTRLLGVTGGYLFGFVVASWIIGWLVDRYIAARTLKAQLLLMTFAVTIIYALGALQLALILRTNLEQTLTMAVLPFIPFDIAKGFAVAAIAHVTLPKQSYDHEADSHRWSKEW